MHARSRSLEIPVGGSPPPARLRETSPDDDRALGDTKQPSPRKLTTAPGPATAKPRASNDASSAAAVLESAWPRTLPRDPRSVDALKRLGVHVRTGNSRMLNLLGQKQLVPMEAVSLKDHARVMWFDPELASLFGFEIPRSDRAPAEALERALLSSLAYRLPRPSDAQRSRDTLTLYADRYGGTGTGNNEGSGRSAFFPYLNLYAKGIGTTPLHRPDPFDPVHEHGLLPVREAAIETVWGGVGSNLFSLGAARTLALIEVGDFVDWAEGPPERACILVRSSLHARPAHLIAGDRELVDHARAFFAHAARDAGLVAGDNKPSPRTIALRMIDAHARVCAEQFRFRILHGAISTSNILLSGEQLDTATMTSQPRTASIRALDWGGTFGQEHLERADELARPYEAIIRRMGAKSRAHQRIDFREAMTNAYREHLDVELMKAAGLKSNIARALANRSRKLAREHATLIVEMSKLANRKGPIDANDPSSRDVSVLDVFNLLGHLPERREAKRDALSVDDALELLRPNVSPEDISRAPAMERLAHGFAQRFLDVHQRLMATAERVALEFYDDLESMRRSVQNRARFENAPLDQLSHSALVSRLSEVSRRYDPFQPESCDEFRRTIDDLIADSTRSVDGLLRQGDRCRLSDGTFELERRTVGGVHYAVRCAPTGARTVHVALPLDDDAASGYRITGMFDGLVLGYDELSSIYYHYTMDSWRTEESGGSGPKRARGRFELDAEARPTLAFSLPVETGDVARLEGVFDVTTRFDCWLKDGGRNFRGYSFAIPDRHEAESLAPDRDLAGDPA